MSSAPLRFGLNHTIVITDVHGGKRWWTVRERRRDGYLLEPNDEPGERRFHGADDILEVYLAGRLEYKPFDAAHFDEARRQRMRMAWDAQSPDRQRRALRREVIVKACLKAIRAREPVGTVLLDVPGAVLDEHREKWAEEDRQAARATFDARRASGLPIQAGAGPQEPPAMTAPCARTTSEWIARYLEMGQSVLALVSYDDRKGYRGSHLTPEVEAVMGEFIARALEKGPIRNLAAYHRLLERELQRVGQPVPSRVTFAKKVRAAADRRQTLKSQQGQRAADEACRINEYVPDPDWLLQQVEIDHTLANLNVVDDASGVLLGRPWITMIMDRLTRCILGCHVSFLPPSWATLSRCIAHALWPKDMTAYSGLEWPQHGKWDWAYTDRGMDFISHPARRSAQLLHFEIANLPGFSPWLKGRIESLFKRFALQAYDYRDGLISWDLKQYDGRKNATVGYAEFRHDIVTWIARDYHPNGHSGLDGQMAPNDFWQSQVDLNFGVTPVDSTGGLRRLLGVSVRRRVSHMGIRVHGLNYNGPGLGAIRDRHGSDVDWYEVRYDPYDLAGVDLLDHVTGEWLTLWCTRPDIANGTTAWQHTFHAQLAGEMARGGVVTEDGLERARAAAQADRDLIIGRGRQGRTKTAQVKLARYLEQGAFLTPIRLFPAPLQPYLPVVTGGTDSGGLITFSQPAPLLLPGLATPVPALVDGSGNPLGGGAPRLMHQSAPALITTPAQKAAADVQARLAARRAERVGS